MSMISKQVKHLLEIADRTQNEAFFREWYNGYAKDLRQAADTIVVLSAKLQVVNTDNGDGWILCEDRLPERGGTYIVTAKENELFHVTFVKWQSKYKRWDLTGTRSYWHVIAWQPLPQPCKAEAGGD